MAHLSRRDMLLMAGATLLPPVAGTAYAQTYPTRPIRLVVGFAAGNAPDIVARLVGERLSESLGQQVIVENRVGAASVIAAQTVASAEPDGHTLLLVTPANTINPVLTGGSTFVQEIAPVAGIASGPMVMVVAPTFPAQTLPDFIRYARANPDKVIMGSPGTGTTPFLSGVMFRMMAGIELVHVPFRGTSQAVTELLGGRVQMVIADMSALEQIRAGGLKALAVTSAGTQAMLPGVPAMGQALPGYEATTWYGIGAPRAVPSEIIARLSRDINAALTDAKVKATLTSMGFEPEPAAPAAFGKRLVEETEKWAKVSQFAGIKQ